MRSTIGLVFATLGFQVWAFPPWLMERSLDADELERLSRLAAHIESDAANSRRDSLLPGFDANEQHISTTGDNAFQPPGPDDLRGPCPGLNALANHGYLPRNGVGTISQFVQSTHDVYGMGLDLGAFLSIYGAVFDGDLTSWSIGGPPPSGLLNQVGLLGQPQGISKSHNKYETDASPTRGDLYLTGDAASLQTDLFTTLYNQSLGPNGYDIGTLTKLRVLRFQQSIDTNPYFFNGPFSGIAVQPAAYAFMYRFMGNKSDQYPEGYLDSNVLKSFFAVTGEPGNFKYQPGHERIPDKWYKRAVGDDYGLVKFIVDLNLMALEHPQFLSVGGNTGTVGSFTGVDLEDLTGGVFNAASLLQGNNAVCFAFQFAQQAAPDILKGVFSSLTKPLAQLNGAVQKALDGLGCPQLEKVDSSLLTRFPGSKGAF